MKTVNLIRLRGEMAALKDVLSATIRSARGHDPVTDRVPGRPKVVGAIIKQINSEFLGRASIHSHNGLPSEPEFRAGYSNMLKEIKESSCDAK